MVLTQIGCGESAFIENIRSGIVNTTNRAIRFVESEFRPSGDQRRPQRLVNVDLADLTTVVSKRDSSSSLDDLTSVVSEGDSSSFFDDLTIAVSERDSSSSSKLRRTKNLLSELKY